MICAFELARLETPARGTVVSIGVFDGVHLGHQAILAANCKRARELGAQSAVLTFRRHPKKVLLGHAPRTLTTLEHRLELFARAGVELVLALHFDENLRDLSAEDFTRQFLVDGLRAREFVLGVDSKFGAGRRGGPDFLTAQGFAVELVPQVVVDAHPVSSTAIREAVELGDFSKAQRMLGRPPSVFGVVVHGDARGHSLGFPTANLDLHHSLHPPIGVYACWACPLEGQLSGQCLPAVTNIGLRPTLNEGEEREPRVEVHLLDFSGDLYGQRLELSFVARLRGEQRFSSLEALKDQIGRDVAQARGLLAPGGQGRALGGDSTASG